MSKWNWGEIAAGANVVAILVGIGFWAITSSEQAIANEKLTALLNTRMDRIYEKVENLPVVAAQLQEHRLQLSTLDGRVRSLEISEGEHHGVSR